MARKPVISGAAALGLAALLATGCQGPLALTSGGRAASAPATSASDPLLSAGLEQLVGKSVPGAKSVPGVPAAEPKRADMPSSPIQRVAATQPADGQKAPPASLPATAPPPAAAPGAPAAEITLPAAIETGLARNPDLIALRESEGVGRAVLGVAGVYPFNPIVQTRVLPIGRNADGTSISTYNYVLLWQTFELAQQSRYRKESAAAALDNARWTIQQAALQNAATTEQLYFAALYQRGLRDLAYRTAQLNDEVLAVMETRLKAGRAAAADVAMARIDARAARQQARLADVTYQNALLALRRQLNVTEDAPLDLGGALSEYGWQPASAAELARLTGPCTAFAEAGTLDALAAQLAAGRPDVFAARANLEAARAALGLARASRIPNVMIGPFYERDTFATLSLGFQAQMEIPVVNTGKPLVRQRDAELRQRQVALEQLEAKARVEARTALDRYERVRLLYEQTRGESNQQMPGELGKLEEEFRKGEIDILRISQARNSLILFRRTYLDSLNELAQAAAAVTAATGLPPAALVVPPGSAGPMLPCSPSPEPTHLPAATLSFRPVE